eukprot:TRINITY_DN8258_c0_g1_i1.p1 TRINITY_DN8258_c0_g1~~TRINITY_DN8258_c0_g1_i1.p1  ORF type:complete len:486 (+),score=83.81 TRINITY_DN8258_c0_g1_i1:20-1477(+)
MDMTNCFAPDFLNCTTFDVVQEELSSTCYYLVEGDFFTFDKPFQWTCIVVVSVYCFLMFFLTLPCRFGVKSVIEKIVGSLDLYPEPDWIIQKDEYEKEDVDDNYYVEFTEKKKHTVYGGLLTLQTIIIVSVLIYITLTTSDSSSVVWSPYQYSSNAHSVYSSVPQQVKYTISAIVSPCPSFGDDCSSLIQFNKDMSGYINVDNFTCRRNDRDECVVNWETPVVDIYNREKDIYSTVARMKFGFELPVEVEKITYHARSYLYFTGNFKKEENAAQNLRDHLENSAIFSQSRYHEIYSSSEQCYESHRNDSVVLSGYFRRIHFSPIPYSRDPITGKNQVHDIISQGVHFLELPYKKTPASSSSDIEIIAYQENKSWYIERTSTLSLIIQLLVLIGISFAISALIQRVISKLALAFSKGIGGITLTSLLSVCFIFAACASLITVVSKTPSLLNLGIIGVIYFSTIFLCIMIRIVWNLCFDTKSEKQHN